MKLPKKISVSVNGRGRITPRPLPLCLWCCKAIKSDEASEVIAADFWIHVECSKLMEEWQGEEENGDLS